MSGIDVDGLRHHVLNVNVVLLAGRFTALYQSGLDELLPAAADRGEFEPFRHPRGRL